MLIFAGTSSWYGVSCSGSVVVCKPPSCLPARSHGHHAPMCATLHHPPTEPTSLPHHLSHSPSRDPKVCSHYSCALGGAALWQDVDNGVSGTLPTEIGWLTGLTNVDLSYNALSKTLPTEVGMLTGLTSIDLGKNSFTGTIPSQIGNCGVPCVPPARSRLTYLNAASPSPGAWTALYSSCESQPPPAPTRHLLPPTSHVDSSWRSDILICGTVDGLGLGVADWGIGQNQFTGSLPSQIGMFTALIYYFDISGNSHTGAWSAVFIAIPLSPLTSFIARFHPVTNRAVGILLLLHGPKPKLIVGQYTVSELVHACDLLRSDMQPCSRRSQVGRLTQFSAGMRFYSNRLSGPIPSEVTPRLMCARLDQTR